jgi:hypothetical protein
MVRAWAWEITTWLDDNRLPAAHAETHYMLNALARGSGLWFLHPETQRWWGREPELRRLHDQIVEWMNARGMAHNSPTPGPRGDMETTDDVRFNQDLADLYRKWELEGRIVEDGRGSVKIWRGSVILKPADITKIGLEYGHLANGKPVFGFRAAREPGPQIDDSKMLGLLMVAASVAPPRVWSKEDSAKLKALIAAEDRGPTKDLTRDERATMLPRAWDERERQEFLDKVHGSTA